MNPSHERTRSDRDCLQQLARGPRSRSRNLIRSFAPTGLGETATQCLNLAQSAYSRFCEPLGPALGLRWRIQRAHERVRAGESPFENLRQRPVGIGTEFVRHDSNEMHYGSTEAQLERVLAAAGI